MNNHHVRTFLLWECARGVPLLSKTTVYWMATRATTSKLRCLSSTYRHMRQPKSSVSRTSCVSPWYLLDLSTNWPSSSVTQRCILAITCSPRSTVRRHMPILSETTVVYPRRFYWGTLLLHQDESEPYIWLFFSDTTLYQARDWDKCHWWPTDRHSVRVLQPVLSARKK